MRSLITYEPTYMNPYRFRVQVQGSPPITVCWYPAVWSGRGYVECWRCDWRKIARRGLLHIRSTCVHAVALERYMADHPEVADPIRDDYERRMAKVREAFYARQS